MKNNFEASRQVAYVIYNPNSLGEPWSIRTGMQRIPNNYSIVYVHVSGAATIATGVTAPDLPDFIETELRRWERDCVLPVMLDDDEVDLVSHESSFEELSVNAVARAAVA